MFKFTKINNIEVEPLSDTEDFDKSKIIGYDYFAQPFCNIFLCARKNSGKTTLIYEILRHILDGEHEQKVHFFVGTIKKDVIYDRIKELLDYHDIEYDENDSIYDDNGQNLVERLFNKINDGNKKNLTFAQHIIIFDDISAELRHDNYWIPALLKQNRHIKSKIIISSQYITDIIPSARLQIDYCLVFGGLSNRNLMDLFNSLNIWLPELKDFIELYRQVTKRKYNFLYIDNVEQVFRENFNTLIEY